MIVPDASTVVLALGDDTSAGDAARARMRGERLAAPHLLDLEVLSAWRRMVAAGRLDERRAALARQDLTALPVRRVEHRRLLEHCWQLRHTLTTYDAAYVALAALLDVPLVTADRRLAGAPGLTCSVDVLR